MTRDEAIARAREMNDDGPPFPGGVAVVMHRGNDHWVEWRGTGFVPAEEGDR
jgi:hypothetical protein